MPACLSASPSFLHSLDLPLGRQDVGPEARTIAAQKHQELPLKTFHLFLVSSLRVNTESAFARAASMVVLLVFANNLMTRPPELRVKSSTRRYGFS